MRVERLICVSWIVCCYGVEPFYSRCAMPMLPSSVLLHRLWSSSSIKACPNLSVALTISLAITVSYMECPLSKAIRSSSSFQTWCRSRAVSGGHIASLPPCIAMQGGSGYGCLVVIVIFASGCIVLPSDGLVGDGGSLEEYQDGVVDDDDNERKDSYGCKTYSSLVQ